MVYKVESSKRKPIYFNEDIEKKVQGSKWKNIKVRDSKAKSSKFVHKDLNEER